MRSKQKQEQKAHDSQLKYQRESASSDQTYRFSELKENRIFQLYFETFEDKFWKKTGREKEYQDKIHKMEETDSVCELVYGARRRTAEISKNDMRVLEPGTYLNDKVIMFQLMFVQHYVIDPRTRQETYIADP